MREKETKTHTEQEERASMKEAGTYIRKIANV